MADDDELEPWDEEAEEPASEEPETYTAEQVEAARAEGRAEAAQAEEAKFNERRSHFDKRHNQTQEALRARGLALTEDGGLAVSDPKTAFQLLMGASAAPQAAQATDDEPPLDLFDPDSVKRYHDWRDAKREREIEARIEAKYGPLLASLDGVQGRMAQPMALQATRAALEELNLSGLDETKEFRDAFDLAYKQMTNEQRLDAAYVEGAAAFVALKGVPKEVRAQVRATMVQRADEQKAQAERDRQRDAMMAQSGGSGTRSVSMGGPGTYGAGGNADQAAIDAQILSELSNEPEFDRDLLRAVNAPPLKDGRSAVQALQERRAKANGR